MKTTCKVCGKSFNLKPSVIQPTGNCCSRACSKIARSAPRPNRKTGTIKTCAVCGTDFYVEHGRVDKVKYCSMKCKGIASRLPKKQCAVCGKTYQPRFGESKRPCCSRECGHLYRKTGKEVPCETCGDMFYTTVATKRFCSVDCSNKWQSRNKTKHTCKICGKTFFWSPSRSKANNISYCSLECRDKDPERALHLRRMNAKQLSMRPNNLERATYAILDSIGIPYEAQYLIGDKFCVDAFVPSAKLVIQFDGDYWHGNPAKFSTLDHRQSRRVTLDKSQDAYMKACGYRVVRIWESEIKKSPEHARQLLAAAIQP